MQVAQSIENEGEKARALSGIAIKLASAGRYESALQITEAIPSNISFSQFRPLHDIPLKLIEIGQYERAMQVAQTISNHSLERDLTLSEMAVKFAEIGQLERALQVAQMMENNSKRAETLRHVATELATAQKFEQALQVISTIQIKFEQGLALGELAGHFIKSGQPNRAEPLLNQALQIAKLN